MTSTQESVDTFDRPANWHGVRVYTLGHSTRSFEELLKLLRAFEIRSLVDIRTIPRSRHNPQFEGDTLERSLRTQHIRYRHLPRLGGLRKPRRDSVNTGWRNKSFQGYADYTLTAEFERGLSELHALAARGTVAIMCAEAVPWRCHRSLVADALTVRGAHVEHIMDATHARRHTLTSFGVVRGTHVIYPAADAEVALDTRAPFHLEATVRVLQRRPTNAIEHWDGTSYLRVLGTPGDLALVEVKNHGTVDAPDVRYSVRAGDPSAAARADIRATLHRTLGLGLDPTAFQKLADVDRKLRPTLQALRGMRPPRFSGWFETFANVVPFQQVSLDAGIATVIKLVARFGEQLEYEERRFYAFPTADSVAEARLDRLRACGLSARKAESLRVLARAIATGTLKQETIERMNTPDALQALEELSGIGPWSAALVLLRGLGRLDVFPSGDAGAKRGLGALLHTESERTLSRTIDRFGDLRGYLYFCALGSKLLARQLVRPADLPAPR